ncbi:unnamed protein product [Brugia timori]|uniref:Uncharacterized protein n=1 Tax=Brugia timori TaxID=42155 RepID=A0A3P7T8H9_9BILA|nr:unnamed protein product [Brugia timori]
MTSSYRQRTSQIPVLKYDKLISKTSSPEQSSHFPDVGVIFSGFERNPSTIPRS